jgi:hypothetical protein
MKLNGFLEKRKWEVMDWINVAQNSDQGWALINADSIKMRGFFK